MSDLTTPLLPDGNQSTSSTSREVYPEETKRSLMNIAPSPNQNHKVLIGVHFFPNADDDSRLIHSFEVTGSTTVLDVINSALSHFS